MRQAKQRAAGFRPCRPPGSGRGFGYSKANMEKTKLILIVAGEASGDLHAANLIRAIKTIQPQIKFFGLGGKKLKEEGLDLYFNIVELAVVGLFEVLKNLKKFKEIFSGLLKEVDSRQ